MQTLAQPYKLGIVGGCFPVQHNIVRKELFHQVLSRMVEEQLHHSLDILIERYERLAKARFKVEMLIDKYHVDAVLFHVRPDPYLRLAKFVYRYADTQNRVRHFLNLPFTKTPPSEHYRVDWTNPANTQENSLCHTLLRNANYLAGMLFGMHRSANDMYARVVDEIIHVCAKNNVDIFILGPASRPHTRLENYLSKKLETRMRTRLNGAAAAYISMFGEYSDAGEYLFFDDGMHVRPAGHHRVAERIFPHIAGSIANTKI